jgi:hypothetical protein
VLTDAPVSVGLALATALAVGSMSVSAAPSASAERFLADKAGVYVGSDLVVRVVGDGTFPATVADRSTIVNRTTGTAGGAPLDVIGVDASTFEHAAFWRSDASHDSLEELLAALGLPGPDGTLPALVVGPALTTNDVVLLNREKVTIRPVAFPEFFGGFHNGATLVVVDRASLLTFIKTARPEVWMRDPPPDAVSQVSSGGYRILGSQAGEDVFDVTSFLAVRWSYGALAAFGAVVASVVLLAQALVLGARRSGRQQAYVMTRRMGVGRWQHAGAVALELALPLVVGEALGLLLGKLVVDRSVVRLDTLRHLQPPAVPVGGSGVVLSVVLGGLVAIVVLAVAGAVATFRAKPMEVVRGTA